MPAIGENLARALTCREIKQSKAQKTAFDCFRGLQRFII
jgi:hypothetical protein